MLYFSTYHYCIVFQYECKEYKQALDVLDQTDSGLMGMKPNTSHKLLTHPDIPSEKVSLPYFLEYSQGLLLNHALNCCRATDPSKLIQPGSLIHPWGKHSLFPISYCTLVLNSFIIMKCLYMYICHKTAVSSPK